MGYYKEQWEALSPTVRKAIEIAAGTVFAIVSMVFLFVLPGSREQDQGLFSLNTIIALAVPLLVPRVLESAVGGKLRLLYRAMLIVLVAGLVAFALLAFVIKPSWLPSVS